MGFSRQEYGSGLSFPSPGDLPHPGIKPGSPALQADAAMLRLPSEHLLRKAQEHIRLLANHQKLGERNGTDCVSKTTPGTYSAYALVLDLQPPEQGDSTLLLFKLPSLQCFVIILANQHFNTKCFT